MSTQEKGYILKDLNEFTQLADCKKPFLCCGKSFMKTDAFDFLSNEYDLTVWSTVRP